MISPSSSIYTSSPILFLPNPPPNGVSLPGVQNIPRSHDVFAPRAKRGYLPKPSIFSKHRALVLRLDQDQKAINSLKVFWAFVGLVFGAGLIGVSANPIAKTLHSNLLKHISEEALVHHIKKKSSQIQLLASLVGSISYIYTLFQTRIHLRNLDLGNADLHLVRRTNPQQL